MELDCLGERGSAGNAAILCRPVGRPGPDRIIRVATRRNLPVDGLSYRRHAMKAELQISMATPVKVT